MNGFWPLIPAAVRLLHKYPIANQDVWDESNQDVWDESFRIYESFPLDVSGIQNALQI